MIKIVIIWYVTGMWMTHVYSNPWTLPKLYRITKNTKSTCFEMDVSCTAHKWRNKWDLSSNGNFLIQEFSVLYMVLLKINKWHWEHKLEYKYYIQMQSKPHNCILFEDTLETVILTQNARHWSKVLHLPKSLW